MERKENILDAAFKIWGRTHFTQMSLTPIAKGLGITKAALYKHFESKEALLQAMERRFLSQYSAFHEQYFQEVKNQDLSGAVRLFMEKVLHFYVSNPYFLSYFYVWLLRTRLAEKKELLPLIFRQKELFKALYREAGMQLEEPELYTRLHFLYVCSTFWASTLFWDPNGCNHPSEIQPPDPAKTGEWKDRLDRWHRYCTRGLSLSLPTPLPYHRIEASLVLPPPPKQEHDRILQAIVDVTQEVGLQQASVERIAEKLGMSKSSLYSHFRNKRSMFETLLREEQKFLLRVLKENLVPLEGFDQRSYGFMYLSAQHMRSHPSLLTLFNWFRFQNIRVPLRPPSRTFLEEYFSFVTEAFQKGEIGCLAEELIPAAALLHVLTFRLLRDTEREANFSDSIVHRIRTMHWVYLHGLSTPMDTKELV